MASSSPGFAHAHQRAFVQTVGAIDNNLIALRDTRLDFGIVLIGDSNLDSLEMHFRRLRIDRVNKRALLAVLHRNRGNNKFLD